MYWADPNTKSISINIIYFLTLFFPPLWLQSMRTQTELELKMFLQDESAYHSMREAALKKPPLAPISAGGGNVKDVSRKK